MYYLARIQTKLHHFNLIWKSFYGNVSDKQYLKHGRDIQNVKRSLCYSSKIMFKKERNTSTFVSYINSFLLQHDSSIKKRLTKGKYVYYFKEKHCKDKDYAKPELISYSNSSSNHFDNISVTVKQIFKQNHVGYIFTSNNHMKNCLRSLHTDSTNYIRHLKHAEDVDIQKENALNHLKLVNQANSNKRTNKCNLNIHISQYPKNVLNSFSSILSQELGKDFNITPVYSKQHNDWICTYHLKWPEPIKISKRGHSKKDASHRAAVATLEWLGSRGKIDSEGKPVIYDAETIKTLYKKSNRKILALDDTTINKLNLIHEEYKSNLFQYLETNVENDTEKQKTVDLTNLENPWLLNCVPQRILDLKNYLTKETVELPIQKYKNDIIELIKKNRIVIIKGETGCGKSIRVPQYVLEGWAHSGAINKEQCKIIVTQPRRIAAISIAERVAYEREEEVGRVVGYQVRFKANFNKSMGRILYCTTGILLRRLQTDPSLIDCTHIIIDEAHERDVNTDLLMNLVRYAMETNSELKLIIMSATINTEIFKEYFKDAVVFSVPGTTFPVKEYYIDSSKIIDYGKTLKMCQSHEPYVVAEDVVDTIKYIHRNKPAGAILCFLPSWEDIRRVAKAIPSAQDMNILCLHSKLDLADQKKVFESPPPGVRKVILSTNIAETSVTINDIVYVIDTGIQKQTKFDADKGIMCLDQGWIAKANVRQRKGRAGRVQPGESFHLYTKKQMENFIQYPIPEILRTSLTKIVLDSKVYSNNTNAIEFLSQLPTPPSKNAIMQAVNHLMELDLLDEHENFTPLGRTLSNFQMEPKLAKTIANAVIFQCITPIIDIVTLFSEETNVFSSSLVNQDDIKEVKSKFSETSDHLAMIKIFEKWLECIENKDKHSADLFCWENGLINYKLHTLQKLRNVYFDYVYNGFNKDILLSDEYSNNDEMVKAVLSSGAASILKLSNFEKMKSRLKEKKTFLTRHNHKVNIPIESVNSKRTTFPTDFMIYLNETRSNVRRTTTVRESSFISLLSLLLFKNEDLVLKEIPIPEYSEELDSKDQVMLTLRNARIECICDRSHAKVIMRCKESLKAGIIHLSCQLTCASGNDPKFDQIWSKILRLLDTVLSAKS